MKKAIPYILLAIVASILIYAVNVHFNKNWQEREENPIYCDVINTFISETISPIPTTLDIPTYPDYIELDRDLVIEVPSEVMANETLSSYSFPKGTKIYFKGE